MNMTLSKRGDYVMRSAIALARAYEGGAPRKIRELVADTEVPRTFASQILADLVRAGLAVSRAGRDGGYRLSRSPEQISVLQVVEAAEGPLRAERCALGEGPCRWDDVCPLHETWSEASARLAELLAATTLAEVAARDEAIEAGRYAVPVDAHRAHARSVELADLVHVELSAPAVHAALAARRSWSAAVGAAVHEVGELVDPSGARRSPLVAECSLDPVAVAGETEAPGESGAPGGRVGPAGESGAPGARTGYLLAWHLSESGGTSHFEGDLSVEVVDPERSELKVTGAWHQETDEAGPLSTDALADRARRVLRGVLRRIARAVEEDHDRSERAPLVRSERPQRAAPLRSTLRRPPARSALTERPEPPVPAGSTAARSGRRRSPAAAS
ncbi:MAG: Rrf2 family transcriptional regulator [Actinomycetota bacterium]|nr:Rrf2 family transcriptional regulator [Actinomycetota bacterium]